MNLQLVSPYKKCPYNCPMCIARTNEEYPYPNLYESDRNQYFQKLYDALDGISVVVVTGSTEPTLFVDWVIDVISFIKVFTPHIKIELQTKNYNVDVDALNTCGLDLISYSITNPVEYAKSTMLRGLKSGKSRITILGTDENMQAIFSDYTPCYSFDQVTIKGLHHGRTDEVNSFIYQSISKYIFERFYKNNSSVIRSDFECQLRNRNISLQLDVDCMDAKDRYKIFRIDGNIYDKWH